MYSEKFKIIYNFYKQLEQSLKIYIDTNFSNLLVCIYIGRTDFDMPCFCPALAYHYVHRNFRVRNHVFVEATSKTFQCVIDHQFSWQYEKQYFYSTSYYSLESAKDCSLYNHQKPVTHLSSRSHNIQEKSIKLSILHNEFSYLHCVIVCQYMPTISLCEIILHHASGSQMQLM